MSQVPILPTPRRGRGAGRLFIDRVALLLTGTAVLGALLVAPPSGTAQGVPGSEKNTCLARKTKCVTTALTALLKCREKCQKNPALCGDRQADCEAMALAKFNGGLDPEKGCFAKAEAKENPGKPASVCTTTDDSLAMETEMGAVADSLLERLEGTPAPFCGDGIINVPGEQCDGSDLGETACDLIGRVGALGCDASCNFDASECIECPAGGVAVGGSCWFGSNLGESCLAACASFGLPYDDATIHYAGSEGSAAQCQFVLEALGQNGSVVSASCTGFFPGVGCSFSGAGLYHCIDPTTPEASSPLLRRACACTP